MEVAKILGYVRKSSVAGQMTGMVCTSCGSQVTRTDVYYDQCGICGVLPMALPSEEWFAAMSGSALRAIVKGVHAELSRRAKAIHRARHGKEVG